ncbi:hypothetical protein ETX26_00575 [Pelagerythrobacter rhizovicinus]|uniref:Uncharacterized protein n=1 Tax=Pelagerythrobacter rhizovicinus TaxID=2268576 RepID=A0A4Q2KSC5_9SPHN|nr:hypothetical protein ETX26_00575 [Pelagerythrobacter rhizovicinus]
MGQETWLGWKLDRADRAALLARFPPRYREAVADHVTFGLAEGSPPMPIAARAAIVGRADDGQGVEAMVVRIAGTTERPTGGTYHITWSLAEGREARESNDVIAAHGWQPMDGAPEVRIESARWPD